jgi:pimeloyl-ACP methyl ester carboxylesterase
VLRIHFGRTRLAAPALAALVVALLLSPVSAQAEESCQELSFPVSVAGLPQTMAGTLCVPGGGANTVQVLVPGGFYNQSYWDIPLYDRTRSFRLAMNRAGYATLTLDRLGTGQSSKPPSVVLTALTQANAVHQVIQTLRPRFDKVIIGGHSLGSAIAVIEAGTYHDVDGVLVTAMGHRLNIPNLAPIFATFAPAALDPAFAARNLDPGYLTTLPGTRFDSLHRPGRYDAAVAAHEESTKDVSAPTELVDAALIATVTPYSRLIDVPVLTVIASQDPTICGVLATNCATAATLRAAEGPFYRPAAQLRAHVLDGYGHSFNYAPNAPAYHSAVVRWADDLVGR